MAQWIQSILCYQTTPFLRLGPLGQQTQKLLGCPEYLTRLMVRTHQCLQPGPVDLETRNRPAHPADREIRRDQLVRMVLVVLDLLVHHLVLEDLSVREVHLDPRGRSFLHRLSGLLRPLIQGTRRRLSFLLVLLDP